MKRYFKRMTCLLVAFMMLVGLLPQSVFATGTEDADKNLYTGKVISVLGDSISTFAGYIPTADGFNLEHLARYPQDNLLTDVNETWWMQVIAELDAKLGINDSWRGATVSGAAPVTTGTSGENASMANLTRIQNLGANGTPDVILFYGGTNDLAHVSAVGTFDAATAPAEVDLATKKWDNLADGYVHTLLRLRHYYPNAQIIALLPAVTTSYYSNEKLAQANAVLAEICTHYDVAYTDLRECGISTSDLPDGIHPNAAGMDYIADAVLDVLTTSSEMIAGENIVYAVTHELTNAKASKSYYKGVSEGEIFAETISGESLTVTVTMDGEDITDECYADGEIHIESVTGDISVQAEAAYSLGERLQALPEDICAGTNLWTSLVHDKEYYTANGWGVHVSGNVYSVTIPVDPEDRIWATSFQASGANGGTINGIRVTWFSQNGVLESVSADRVYAEFAANGYLSVPEGAVAVNIPMWTNGDSNTLYILNRDHSYKNGACTCCCISAPALAGKSLSILGASISTYAGASNGAAAETTNSTIRNNVKYYPNTTIPDVGLNDTWWMQVCNDLGLQLLVNNSWSGSALLYERGGTVGAYIDRCVQLHDDTGDNAGETPDIIGIQMGTNDFQYYKDTLGTADIDYAILITENADGTFTYAAPTTSLEAAAIVLHKISVRYPRSEVYYLNISQRVDGTDELIRSFNAELKQVVEHFGGHVVDIYGSAITMADFDTYIGDGRVHPNKLGMDSYTEAFKRALLANTAYSVETHTVAFDLTDVTVDYGDDKIVVNGDAFSANLAAAGSDLEVTVTMGGKDITADVYVNGTVTIDAVTADVVITAKRVEHELRSYRWEFDGTDLVSAGETENALTKNAGTTTDGVFSSTRYALESAVVLSHDEPWAVEWKSEGTWKNSGTSSGGRMFTTTDVNAEYNARYIFKSATNWIIAMGEKTTTGSHNYGIALADHGIDASQLHTYRLENHIAEDDSNMVWLYVDGEEIGPMTGYYIGTSSQKTTSDWLNGKDFVFPYMGTDTHGFTNCSIEYIQVWEAGHVHSYITVETPPSCTETGYTTYTCACGDSYVADYVDAKGHRWESNVCSVCGKSKKDYQRLTYFTVDVMAENGETYTDNAVLYLPVNYSPKGEPVKLIIYCKQGSSTITPSSNPIETVGFYNYLISLGYAILGVDGVPDAWCTELGLDETRVVGNPLAVQGTERAYDYVIENYNIDPNGCFISGYSQGGHYAQNVIDLTDIPILAAAEQSPVCSMRYHQWDLNSAKTIGGVSFTKAARLNVARIFGFPTVTSNEELLNLTYDNTLVDQYDPWVRNSKNVYTGFVQNSNLWYLPEGTSVNDITMTKTVNCPVKIWCAEDDTAISADVMKVFVKAIQNAGGTAELSVAYSGGHGFFAKQNPVGTFVENGQQYNTLPIAVEIAQWFARFGGYECEHTYENGTCTGCGAEDPGAMESMHLRYDDHLDVSGKRVEIIDAGIPTSYQVGYGVEENTVRDTAVVTLEGDALVATGTGTAYVRIDGQIYEITVTAAPISLLLLAGQSNMQGSEGDANQSIVCPDGMVYATYGDRYNMTIDNATNYAASALTGPYSTVNVNGTTDCISGYPIYSLNEAGVGKEGPDSGFAYEWVKQTGEKVWVVNAAHGGSAISTWQTTGVNYKEAVTLFSACQETLRKEIAAGHFVLSHMGYFWCQGCADETQTAQWYVDKYLAMHESLKINLAADMDSDPATPDMTLEFGGIIPIRSGHQNAGSYRAGTYTSTTSAPYFESFKDLRMNGPRVAQYWMGNNPELTDIWNVCTIQEDWVTMPDGNDGVAEYFQAHYENGTVDYTTQVKQIDSWYVPTTPAAVHDSIHYNQIGYNEVGREAARNALIYLGEVAAPETETTVKFVGWDGFTEVTDVICSTVGSSNTLVVPMVNPVYKSKEVTYPVSDGLSYDYYDLLADSVAGNGTLTVSGAKGGTVTVAAKAPTAYRWECDGTTLISITDDGNTPNSLTKAAGTIADGVFTGVRYDMSEPVILRHDLPWVVEWKMTGDWSGMILAANGTSTVEGNTYLFKTTSTSTLLAFGERSGGQYLNYGNLLGASTDFSQPHVYRLENRITDDGNMAYLLLDGVEIGPMNRYYIGGTNNQNQTVNWASGRDFVFSHIGTSGHAVTNGSLNYLAVMEDAGECDVHFHDWSDWTTVSIPSPETCGIEQRICFACGMEQTRDVEGVWQKLNLSAHLAELPDAVCCNTNLWAELEHDSQYFANGVDWGVHSSGKVYSVTIPVSAGDQIYASAFGAAGTNGSNTNGIRVTFFDAYGVAKTLAPADTYAEFAANGGYLLAPEGVVASNVPMWNNSDENELYILNAEHDYDFTVTAPTCTEVGYTTYSCHCGDNYTADEVEALDHKFGDYAPDNNATCAADGTKTAKCENCEETDTMTDVGTMKDHTYTDAEDADCNVCGYVREIAIPSVPMFRMYDPNGGEHFYTGSEEERDILEAAGWNYEGVAFNFPVVGAPVHRLYNPTSGDHLYTMDEDEMAGCLDAGWNYEGVAFNSAAPDQVPQYRLWNPNAIRGAWHFTGSTEERDWLLDLGWRYQGIGWYSEWV